MEGFFNPHLPTWESQLPSSHGQMRPEFIRHWNPSTSIQGQERRDARPHSGPSACSQKPKVNPIRKRGKLPKETTEFLRSWLMAHANHPYPTEQEKKDLCSHTGLTMSQLCNWVS